MSPERSLSSPIAGRASISCILALVLAFATAFDVQRVVGQSFTCKIDGVGNGISVSNGKWLVGGTNYGQNLEFCNILVTPLTISGSSYPTGTPEVLAFCAEINQDVSGGKTYGYNFNALGQADGGLSTLQVREIRILFDYYYTGDTTAVWTSTTAAAFQACLWKIESDSGTNLNIETGSFRDNGSGDTFVTVAQGYLNAIAATGSNYVPQMNVLTITSPTCQDLMFSQGVYNSLIPFPVGALPGAACLGILVFLRVQRRLLVVIACDGS